MLRQGDSIFDGFMRRPYSEDTDGWMNYLMNFDDNPAVQMAREIVNMSEDINYYRKLVWQQEQELKRLRLLAGY